jgi:hypothetical protein
MNNGLSNINSKQFQIGSYDEGIFDREDKVTINKKAEFLLKVVKWEVNIETC